MGVERPDLRPPANRITGPFCAVRADKDKIKVMVASGHIMGIRPLFLLSAAGLALIFMTLPAGAQKTSLAFTPSQNPANADYQAALQIMAPIFKEKMPDFWDAKQEKWRAYPLIDIAKSDLNGDGNADIIAYPIELEPEYTNVLCPSRVGCPFFVAEITDGKIRTLGLFPAYRVDADNTRSSSGYIRLRAYTKTLNDDPNYYELYEYDAARKTYVMLKPE